MPILQLKYYDVTGPVGVTYGTLDGKFARDFMLAAGQKSSARAVEAATLISADMRALGIDVQAGVLADYPATPVPAPQPPVELTQAEKDYNMYAKRLAIFKQFEVDFPTWNLARIRTGEFTSTQIRAWLTSDEGEAAISLMRKLDFEGAKLAINAMVGDPATPSFKSYWTAKIEEAILTSSQ